ncbi:helix-turn-helix transcriptional regulator [Flavobacterium sp.]|uniref:helix-turn-helix transcriptional regulator n=2 Tax=Flavobacterium sp. TaxID=239 RepID=UPI00375152A6
MKKSFFIFLNYFIFLIPFINSVKAQKSNQELTQLINKKGISENDKFQYLCDISKNYAHKDSVKAYGYLDQALKIAKKEKSIKKEIIAYDYIAYIARYNENIVKQIAITDYCITLANISNDEEVIAYKNCLLAYKYKIINDNENYIYYMLKSLAYFEREKKRYDKLVLNYGNVGAYFGNKNDLNIFGKYAQKSLTLGIESKNDINIANSLTTWGNYICDKGRLSKPVNKVLSDSALNCYKKAIKLFENSSNDMILSSFPYGRTCANLSSLYIADYMNMGYEETIQTLKKSERVCLNINDPSLLMVIYGQLTQFYIKNKDIINAEKTLKKTGNFLNNLNQVEPRYQAVFYYDHMNLAALKDDFKSYREYFAQYDVACDAVNTEKGKIREYNATIKFETEQKNKEIQSLTLIANERKKINYLLITLSILAFLTLIFMYKIYQYRRNAYIKVNEDEAISTMLELEIANREKKIAIQEKLLTEQQKEKLQHNLMTNNLHLESKKIILKDIQQKLLSIKSSELKPISKTISKSIEIDHEFELLQSNFENTNPVFFTTLQKKASNSLTKLDLKYCGYIKLGMGIKEMANIMNIEPKSMKMARYRLRQKLNLGKEEDLNDFINTI